MPSHNQSVEVHQLKAQKMLITFIPISCAYKKHSSPLEVCMFYSFTKLNQNRFIAVSLAPINRKKTKLIIYIYIYKIHVYPKSPHLTCTLTICKTAKNIGHIY